MRKRFFIGILPLLILLLGIGAYAIWLFSQLGGAVDSLLREDYRSIGAMQQLRQAAGRIDASLLLTTFGEPEQAQPLWDENVPLLRKSLRLARDSVTIPTEQELVNRLTGAVERFMDEANQLRDLSDPAVRRRRYFAEMQPAFNELMNTIGDVRELNESHMAAADWDARELSARSTKYMLIALIAGLVAAFLSVLRLKTAILGPIQTVTSAAKQLGEGNLGQEVPVVSQDELGDLAVTFNRMAATVAEKEAQLRANATRLEASKLELEQALRVKSEFLSRMSHELRTPLTAILGFSQLLEDANLAPDDQACVEQILKAGRHLLALVDKVLAFENQNAGWDEVFPPFPAS